MEFETFAYTHHGRLIAALTLYCGDRWVAEELAQDALVRALERWNRVREMTEPGAWLQRVAINLANSRLRRRSAERRALSKVRPGHGGEAADSAEVMAVRTAVAQLPRGQRAAVVCRYFLGYSVDETARLLGIAPGSVKSNTHRGLTTLRKTFDVTESGVDAPRSARYGEANDVA